MLILQTQKIDKCVTFVQDDFVATAGQTTFNLSGIPSNESSVFMFINQQAVQSTVDFTLSGNVVTYNGSYTISAGDDVRFKYVKCADIPTPPTVLNEFTFATGTAPSIPAFETMLGGIVLINGNTVSGPNGDSITFDNTGYNIPQFAFAGTTDLKYVTTMCLSIDNKAFDNSSIQTINAPMLDKAFDDVFQGCYNLNSVSMPVATYLGNGCFMNTPNMVSFSFPNIIQIRNLCFRGSGATTYVFGTALTNIGGTAGDEKVFWDTAGTTINITLPVSFQTNNGGSIEGDIDGPNLTPPATFNYTWL